MKIKHFLVFSFLIFYSFLNRVECNFLERVNIYVSNKYNDVINYFASFNEMLSSISDISLAISGTSNILEDNLKFKESFKNIFKIIDSLVENEDEKETPNGQKKESFNLLNMYNGFFEYIDLTFSYVENEAELFVNGIFEGISSVPIAENKCYKEIQKDIRIINSKIVNLLKSIKSGGNIIDKLFDIHNILETISYLNENCNLKNLNNEIKNCNNFMCSFYKTLTIFRNSSELFENLVNGYKALKKRNFNKVGIALGKVIQIIFNFSTK
jgi:hypothetical protein